MGVKVHKRFDRNVGVMVESCWTEENEIACTQTLSYNIVLTVNFHLISINVGMFG